MDDKEHQYEYGALLRSDPTLTVAEAEQQLRWSPRRLRPRIADGKDSGKRVEAEIATRELAIA